MSDVAPTPAETVAALLEQGWTPAQVVADAEQAVADAEAGIEWVSAVAAEASGVTDSHLSTQLAAQEAINRAKSAGASPELIEKAEKGLRDASLGLHLAAINAGDARVALTHFTGHANETISLARARIKAAER